MKLFKQTLLIFAILSTITSCSAQLVGKYRMVENPPAQLVGQHSGVIEIAKSSKGRPIIFKAKEKQTNKLKQEVIKEYKKDGTFTSHTIDKYNKVLNFVGKYKVVNDSIYIEFIEYDSFGKVGGKALPMKYEIKNDTLIQKGEVYYKINGTRNNYYKNSFKNTWKKIKD